MSNNHAAFIWSIADLLRGSYRPHQYGDVILPFTVLRRLDSVLEPTKNAVLAAVRVAEAAGTPVRPALLKAKAGHTLSFYNRSRFTLASALGDANAVAENLLDYVDGFSANVEDIFTKYKLADRIHELNDRDLLFHVAERFAEVDLSPATVPNEEMGHIFEELIRKFAEASNETAGDHFTPRDVVRLMVDLILAPESTTLTKPGITKSIYDPTAGTGGMLSVGEDRVHELNPSATMLLAGQEYNPESYAICKADMLVKGQAMDAIQFGDTLLDDKHAGTTFNYCLSNPPFGVDWKKQQSKVTEEHKVRGYAGRFGPGLPRVSDGSMLFLMHLISKMREKSDGAAGGRAAIVLNGSPLFTGGAGSGESNIRKWVLDHDYLETIVAMPNDMFYNTGIATYVWVLSKDKTPERQGKVQLIDGSKLLHKMKKGLGSKRNELSPEDIDEIVKLYGAFEDEGLSKVFPREAFYYRTITVERPLRQRFQVTPERIAAALATKAVTKLSDEDRAAVAAVLGSFDADRVWMRRADFVSDVMTALRAAGVSVVATSITAIADAVAEHDDNAEIVRDLKGKPLADSGRRDTENVPWTDDMHEHFAREVLPFAPDAWIDESKTKEGCEIPFTRHFYVYVPPRPLEEIDADLERVLGRIRARLEQVRS